MRQAVATRKRRKAQKLGVNVEVFFRADIERLASHWRLRRLEHAARARPPSRRGAPSVRGMHA